MKRKISVLLCLSLVLASLLSTAPAALAASPQYTEGSIGGWYCSDDCGGVWAVEIPPGFPYDISDFTLVKPPSESILVHQPMYSTSTFTADKDCTLTVSCPYLYFYHPSETGIRYHTSSPFHVRLLKRGALTAEKRVPLSDCSVMNLGENTIVLSQNKKFTFDLSAGTEYSLEIIPVFAVDPTVPVGSEFRFKAGDAAFTLSDGSLSGPGVSGEERYQVHNVTLSTAPGCTVTPVNGSTLENVPHNGKFQFTVGIDEGYRINKDFAVTVNGSPIVPDSSACTWLRT